MPTPPLVEALRRLDSDRSLAVPNPQATEVPLTTKEESILRTLLDRLNLNINLTRLHGWYGAPSDSHLDSLLTAHFQEVCGLSTDDSKLPEFKTLGYQAIAHGAARVAHAQRTFAFLVDLIPALQKTDDLLTLVQNPSVRDEIQLLLGAAGAARTEAVELAANSSSIDNVRISRATENARERADALYLFAALLLTTRDFLCPAEDDLPEAPRKISDCLGLGTGWLLGAIRWNVTAIQNEGIATWRDPELLQPAVILDIEDDREKLSPASRTLLEHIGIDYIPDVKGVMLCANLHSSSVNEAKNLNAHHSLVSSFIESHLMKILDIALSSTLSKNPNAASSSHGNNALYAKAQAIYLTWQQKND